MNDTPEPAGGASIGAQRDEAAIRQQIGRIVEALRDQDLAVLGQLYAPDVVSFDIDPPLQHVGVAAKLKNWERAFTFFREIGYEVRDLTVTVGESVAYAYGFGRLGGTLRDGTTTSGIWVRATFCFRRVGETWLIAHDQVSVPLDISTGSGVTDLHP